MICATEWMKVSKTRSSKTYFDIPLATLDNLEVNGAAHDASPSLIFGTSSSESISAKLFVIESRLNCH